jgi:ribosomal protein L29
LDESIPVLRKKSEEDIVQKKSDIKTHTAKKLRLKREIKFIKKDIATINTYKEQLQTQSTKVLGTTVTNTGTQNTTVTNTGTQNTATVTNT